MGIDLSIIGNHKIEFKNRDFEFLSKFIQNKLNKLLILNYEYLYKYSLEFYNREGYESERRNILESKDWKYLEENVLYNFSDDKEIILRGPCSLELKIMEDILTISNPPIRYSTWFSINNSTNYNDIKFIKIWRTYFRQIIYLFGGDRVIYLPDSGHNLQKYQYYDTLEKIEESLLSEVGKPCLSMNSVLDDIERNYFIDYFKE